MLRTRETEELNKDQEKLKTMILAVPLFKTFKTQCEEKGFRNLEYKVQHITKDGVLIGPQIKGTKSYPASKTPTSFFGLFGGQTIPERIDKAWLRTNQIPLDGTGAYLDNWIDGHYTSEHLVPIKNKPKMSI